MKKPVFLILIGIGVALLVVGVVFVVPWFGKMIDRNGADSRTTQTTQARIKNVCTRTVD